MKKIEMILTILFVFLSIGISKAETISKDFTIVRDPGNPSLNMYGTLKLDPRFFHEFYVGTVTFKIEDDVTISPKIKFSTGGKEVKTQWEHGEITITLTGYVEYAIGKGFETHTFKGKVEFLKDWVLGQKNVWEFSVELKKSKTL